MEKTCLQFHLKLVKSFVLLIWDTRKNDQDGETSGYSCSCPLTKILQARPAHVSAWPMA